MKKLLLSFVGLVLLVPMFSMAADIRHAELIPSDQKVTNLYLAGQNPTVDANVTGDLVVGGGTVTVNGNVSGGVLAAGGNLNLNGKVAQSVRVAGGMVNVNNNIGGDLVVFGGNVLLGSKSTVLGDVIIYAGTVEIQGQVVGAVKHSYAGNVTIAGKVGHNVDLNRVGMLKVEDTAVIGGTINYYSQNEATIASGAKVGHVNYTKVAAPMLNSQKIGTALFFTFLFGLVMTLIALLVLISLLPKFAKDVVNASVVNPWKNMGIGFLALVVTPIVLIALLITFVGWGVMGFLFLAYGAFIAIAGAFSALFVGSWTWKYFRKEKDMVVDWKTASIGVLILAVAKLVPILGWLAVFLVFLIVFGALTTMGYEFVKAQRA